MRQTMVGESKSVTADVVEEIADAEGVDVLNTKPLFESVDPDALETIFEDPATTDGVRIDFVHDGYQVTIDGGRVSVEEHDGGA